MRSGRILVAVLFLLGLVGVIFSGEALYSRLLYVSSSIIVISWVWAHWVARGLKLERSSRLQRAKVGEIFEESYQIHNNSRVLAPWIEVRNQANMPFASGSRLFTFVQGKQMRNYLARTWLTTRGAYDLGPTRISTGDPFNLFNVTRIFESQEQLLVFPEIHEISDFIYPPGLLPGGQVIRRKSPDITPHAAGVREYVHGDAMKRIHWPTSVRRGHLMVKEFEQDPQAEVWLYLDSQESMHVEIPYEHDVSPVDTTVFFKKPKFNLPPSTLEYSVSITASLTHYFIKQRRSVGYISVGQNFAIHPAERSERQEAKILETLSFVKANGQLSIAALVSAQSSQLPQGSTVVLITPTVSDDLLHAVNHLQMRYLRPLVILLDSKTFGGFPGTDELVNSLHERRIPVTVIRYGDNLSGKLSELSLNFKFQDVRTWQTPTSSQ